MFGVKMPEIERKWRNEALCMYNAYLEELKEALEKIEDKEEKCVKMSAVVELMDMDRSEISDDLEKMCDEKKLDIVLKLTFGEIRMTERHMLDAQLSDYKQTLTLCLQEEEEEEKALLEMWQIPGALNYGWHAFRTSEMASKEERKKLVWKAFSDYVKERKDKAVVDNAVLAELCNAFANLGFDEVD